MVANHYKKVEINPFEQWRKINKIKYTTLYSEENGVWQLPHADFAPTPSNYKK